MREEKLNSLVGRHSRFQRKQLKESAALSIVVVNWRSGRYVQRCLLSIDRFLRRTTIAYEVIVVDNTPWDAELAGLDNHPAVRIVRCASNLGFARACNSGAKLARGELLLFLNPDTELVDASILTACAWLLQNPSAGVVGCRQVGVRGDFQENSIQRFPTILNQLIDSQLAN